MIKFTELANAAPQVAALIDNYGRRILEQSAELADHRLSDKLLLQLVMQYVQAEQQLHELNGLKNKFLGIAAHDLRNPLTAIRGMSQLLLEMDLDEAQKKELLSAVYQSSDDMLRLVNDLLDVSVIESGKLKLRIGRGNVTQLVQARLRLLAPAAEKKNIRLETSLPPIDDSMFDSDRFAQVVDNLISNAIKFSPRDSTVQIALRRTGDSIEFSVRDQGPGLSACDREKLFSAFEKLSAQPTGGEKSTGLGLAIVKKIMDAQHGTIEVLSEPAAGAEFKVLLPIHFEE